MIHPILAIDPGLSTGYAWTDGQRLVSGQWNLGCADPKGKVTMQTWANRCGVLNEAIRHMMLSIRGGRTHIFVVERVTFAGKAKAMANTKNLQRYIGVIALLSHIYGAGIIEVGPQEWKASIGGGRMTPEQYQKAAQSVWHLPDLPQEDEAAALGMLAWAVNRDKRLSLIGGN